MPLPWLIGAAAVLLTTAVVKAITDDDDMSSSTSGKEERRSQEREASRQRERDSLSAKLGNNKKNRLVDARKLLAESAKALGKRPSMAGGLTTSKFETALKAKTKATSLGATQLWFPTEVTQLTSSLQAKDALKSLGTFFGNDNARMADLNGEPPTTSLYAKSLRTAMAVRDHSSEDCTQKEQDDLLVNLQILENLSEPVQLSAEEQQDFAALQEAASRLQKLQHLKNQIEQQG